MVRVDSIGNEWLIMVDLDPVGLFKVCVAYLSTVDAQIIVVDNQLVEIKLKDKSGNLSEISLVNVIN